VSPVPVEALVAQMDARWRAFGNVSSPNLRDLWAKIAGVLNAQIEAPSARWPVIPAELGAGKTTLAKQWCALLPRDEHPGILVVVRTIDQAEEYARDVNEWAGTPCASTYHSRLSWAQRRDVDVLSTYPTLVVCHKAYEVGLDMLAVNEAYPKFEKLHTYRGDRRRLVIVDEALDQIHEARVQRDELRRLLERIPRDVEKAHAPAIDILEAVARALRRASDNKHRVLAAEDLLAGTQLTPESADVLLVALWNALRISNRVSPDDRVEMGEAVTAIRRHLAAYRWSAAQGPRTTLSGHRLLLMPPGTHGVVLDATARLNNVYRGRPDQFEVRDVPRVRQYGAVSVYVAKTAKTGKTLRSQRDGAERADATLQAVLDRYGDAASNRRVLVVCAANGETFFSSSSYAGRFAVLATAHWNKLDGRNDWREFDTLVIATLPYTRVSTDLNTYMAVRGEELDDAGLNQPPDDVRVVRETRVAAQIAQAIGRIRLRTMKDESGACEPCDVFLRLPNWRLMVDADRLLDAVLGTLPGAVVKPWTEGSARLPRTGRTRIERNAVRDALVAYVEAMPAGTWQRVRDVRRAIGAGAHGTWFRVQEEAGAVLGPLGARIEPARGHRPARLVKVA